MKLKLTILNTDTLKTALSLVSSPRRHVVLKFCPESLTVMLTSDTSGDPQIWAKLQMSMFDSAEIQSVRDNNIVLELNVDLLVQTLKHFDKAESDGINIRLQRKDSSGGQGTSLASGRTASLALFYSNTSSSTTVNHTFRIPVRILKATESISLNPPKQSHIDLIVKLQQQFTASYKRLEKFKKSYDSITVKVSRRQGGVLGFVLEDEGKFNTIITWNGSLVVNKPKDEEVIGQEQEPDDDVDENDIGEDKQITLKLIHWKMGSRLVSTCRYANLLIADQEAAMLHCLLDDNGEVEIVYYMSGIKSFD